MSINVDNFSVHEQLEMDRSETPSYRQPDRRFIDLSPTRFPRVGPTLETYKYSWKMPFLWLVNRRNQHVAARYYNYNKILEYLLIVRKPVLLFSGPVLLFSGKE